MINPDSNLRQIQKAFISLLQSGFYSAEDLHATVDRAVAEFNKKLPTIQIDGPKEMSSYLLKLIEMEYESYNPIYKEDEVFFECLYCSKLSKERCNVPHPYTCPINKLQIEILKEKSKY
jgi:hypothetical protein